MVPTKMHNLIAQIEIPIPGNIEGIGPLGLEGRAPAQSTTLFNVFLSTIIGLMTIIAAIWFTFLLITGAISIITSGGDKTKVAEARGKITTAIIGLVVVIAAIFIIQLIGTLLGFNLILNPGEFIQQITPWGP